MSKDFHLDIQPQKYLGEWQVIQQKYQLNMKWKEMFILFLLFFGKWWQERFLGLIVFLFSSFLFFFSFFKMNLKWFKWNFRQRCFRYWIPSSTRPKRRNSKPQRRSKSWIIGIINWTVLETKCKWKTHFQTSGSKIIFIQKHLVC